MGTSQDYRVAAEEGATLVRVGSVLYGARIVRVYGSRRRLEPRARLLRHRRGGRVLGRGGLRRRGGARADVRPRPPERAPAAARGARQREEFEDWSEPDAQAGAQTAVAPRAPSSRPLEAVAAASVKVHLVVPRSFNDAQSIADKFKDSVPVIVNLQSADPELSKRLIDFSSGLTYALEREHAAGRRQGVPPHAAQRRGLGRGARAPDRPRLLQPVVSRSRVPAGPGGRFPAHAFRGRDLDGRRASSTRSTTST